MILLTSGTVLMRTEVYSFLFVNIHPTIFVFVGFFDIVVY